MKFGPDDVRALRGDLSRQEFAELVGVSELTIYRWELEDGAPQARRPRAGSRRKLRAVARALALERPLALSQPSEPLRTPLASPSPGALRPQEPVEHTPPPPVAPRDAAAVEATKGFEDPTLSPVFRRIARHIAGAEFEAASSELLNRLASASFIPVPSRALAQVEMALLSLLAKNDVRGGFGALVPPLSRADAGQLPNSVAARAHVVAALVFSSCDGQIFDIGRVNSHAAHARRLAGGELDELFSVVLAVAELQSAYHFGDRALFESVLARHDSALRTATLRVPGLLAQYVFGLRDYMVGRHSDATVRFATLEEKALACGFGWMGTVASAFRALLAVHAGAPADAVEEIVAAGRATEANWHIEAGMHDVMWAAARGQVRVRDGRFEEAADVIEGGARIAERMAWPPVDLLPCQARLFMHGGRRDQLVALKDRLAKWPERICPGPMDASAAFVDGIMALAQDAPEEAVVSLRLARGHARQCGVVPALERAAATMACCAAAHAAEAGDEDFFEAERTLERLPSGQSTGILRFAEALRASRQGHLDRAQERAGLAVAALDAARDATNAALARRLLSLLAVVGGSKRGRRMLSDSDAEVESLGMSPHGLMTVERFRAFARLDGDPLDEVSVRTPLVEAVERLSVRGVSTEQLVEELLGAAQRMFGRPCRVVELTDSASAGNDATGFEVSNFVGGRFRLEVPGELTPTETSNARVLAIVAGMAMEAAALRGGRVARDLSHEDTEPIDGLFAASAAMRQVASDIRRLRESRATVLVTGESGVGKEVAARAIHDTSARSDRPFVTFNCAAVPRELFEGHLFGHRKGAFTGATSDHLGVIRSAHTGTLFLDEIGDLPADVQPKLLRFLENGEVFPVGETRPKKVDVRVIAATHRDLREMTREGTFREDLLYRLQVVPIALPPLRDRPEDIPVLAGRFLRELVKGTTPKLSAEAEAMLMGHSWPGNVRELRNVMERAVAFSPVPSILGTEHIRF